MRWEWNSSRVGAERRERFPDLRSRVRERTTADLGFDGRNGKQKLGTGSEKSGRGVGMKQVSEIGRLFVM